MEHASRACTRCICAKESVKSKAIFVNEANHFGRVKNFFFFVNKARKILIFPHSINKNVPSYSDKLKLLVVQSKTASA